MSIRERIHSTYASEQEARKVASEIYAAGGRACVESVRAMALANDPLTPRTINPWCVIVKERTEEPSK